MAEAVTDKPKPAYSDDGVDLTLIRWMLSFTPRERLLVLQRHMNAIEKLRNAFRSAGGYRPQALGR